uniref:Unannotated protein n=1 Tax=freshwater metagenome TaxID=449393 RepID=A0A6J7MGH6_9ZZZZ
MPPENSPDSNLISSPPRTRRKIRVAEKSALLTRAKLIDAALETILAVGYYRASSNEIARRAEVSWGAVQHHFGSRERLMYAAFEAACTEVTAVLKAARVTGDTVEERLLSVQDVVFGFFGKASYVGILQVMWNLTSDPDTSDELHGSLRAIVAQIYDEYVRLMLQVSPDASTEFAWFSYMASWGLAVAAASGKVLRYADDLEESNLLQRRLLSKALSALLSESTRTAPAGAALIESSKS